MKVSLAWLKDYAPLKTDVHQLAERLTMTLTEVEEIVSVAGLRDIKVGEVLEVGPHPNADNVRLTKTRVGTSTYRIVCGAPNVAAGQKVAVALPGVTLPGDLTIEKRKIRGETSEGMICSPKELGLSDDHEGIWVLPADAKVGVSLPTALKGDHDTFELDVQANRPDCLGHLGVAREAAAACGVAFKEPKLRTPATPKRGPWRHTLDGKRRATRFSLAVLTGVTNGQSPAWLQRRLIAVGQRPINAVVDVTNFVMLETGQPLHAYDASKLSSQQFGVRPAKAGERLRTLDGKERQLDNQTLVISNGSAAVGLAGIMGGADSEVDQQTTSVVLECAHFDQATIRRTARRLGLRTEASARFEKGISEEATWDALRRAVDLIRECGGGSLQQLTDTRAAKPSPTKVKLSLSAAADFLGGPVVRSAATANLKRLGYTASGSAEALQVTVPWWRTDVSAPVDLYEDIARLTGFDAYPATLPVAQVAVPTVPAEHRLASQLSDLLVQAGYLEIMTHSLDGRPLLERAGYRTDGLVEMTNPLSEDHRYLRRTMEPRHLEAVADNLRWRDQLALFEVGTVFQPAAKGQVQEKRKLLATLADSRERDLFPEARGLLDFLVTRLRLDPAGLSFETYDKPQYVPGRHYMVHYGGQIIGRLGQAGNPRQWKAGTVCFVTLKFPELLKVLPTTWQAEPLPQFPAVGRDLSVVVPDELSYADLRQAILAAKPAHLSRVGRASEYRKAGRRSLLVPLEFRADRTLTDAEVNQSMRGIEAAAAALGAEVR